MPNLILLFAAAIIAGWLVRNWFKSAARQNELTTPEQQEIDNAKAIGEELEREYQRRSKAAVEGNEAALAKAEKARRWIDDAKLNLVIPELLDTVKLWPYWIKLPGDRKWTPPDGVTKIEGLQDRKAPWASWQWNGHHWRIEAEWHPSSLPDDFETENGTYRVLVDQEPVLDMTLSSDGLRTMWIDALTVGPWVSELVRFAGDRKLESQALSSASFAKSYQQRADRIHL